MLSQQSNSPRGDATVTSATRHGILARREARVFFGCVLLWNRQQVEELMRAHGYQRLDPQEVKARELAESWVQIHRQWKEAVYGVEEELLIEEARDIKKEARRRGLTERVNALLRERKFEGELLS